VLFDDNKSNMQVINTHKSNNTELPPSDDKWKIDMRENGSFAGREPRDSINIITTIVEPDQNMQATF